MILTCASCATRYYADEASIPPQGRVVRCAACGNTWRVEKELVLDNGTAQPATFVDEPKLTREQIERARRAAPSSASSPTAQARARQIQRQRLEKLRAAAIAWGGAGAALAVLLTVAVVFRQGVAKVWPSAASAYAAMGLSVNITGLEFSDLDISRGAEGEAAALTVSGAVRNIGGQPKSPPVLRFGLLDRNADEVHSWMVSLDGPPIPPGGARQFSTALVDPPVSAVDLEATFATASEARNAPPPSPVVAPAHAPAPAKDSKPKTGHAPGGSNPGALTVIEPSHEAEAETAPEHAAEPGH
ncbi:MAG: MJ0042-type zinc finger domain-containing protein [Pseudomonadota bacterium]